MNWNPDLRGYNLPGGDAMMAKGIEQMRTAYDGVLRKAVSQVLGYEPSEKDAHRVVLLRAPGVFDCETIVVDGFAIGTIAWNYGWNTESLAQVMKVTFTPASGRAGARRT